MLTLVATMIVAMITGWRAAMVIAVVATPITAAVAAGINDAAIEG